MKNFVQPGDVLTLPMSVTRAAGLGVTVGNIIGVLVHDAVSGQDAEVALRGVYDVEKSALAINRGDLAYMRPEGLVSTNPSGNRLCGVFTEPALIGDATGRVRLNGYFSPA